WPDPVGPAVQTGRDRMETHETRYSPRLSRRYGALRLRPHFPDALDHQGRDAARRNLLELPSFLHWQAETRGYPRPCRALPEEIRRRRRQIHRRQKINFFVGAQHTAPQLLQNLAHTLLPSSPCPLC